MAVSLSDLLSRGDDAQSVSDQLRPVVAVFTDMDAQVKLVLSGLRAFAAALVDSAKSVVAPIAQPAQPPAAKAAATPAIAPPLSGPAIPAPATAPSPLGGAAAPGGKGKPAPLLGVNDLTNDRDRLQVQAAQQVKKEREGERLRREVARQKGEDPDKAAKEKAAKDAQAKKDKAAQEAKASQQAAGGNVTSSLSALQGGVSGIASFAGGAIGTAIAGPVGAAIGSALGSSLAEIPSMIKDSLTGLVDLAKPFVAAFNPQAIVRFNKAVDDISATIGYALEPIVTTFTDVVRNASGAIRPAFDAIRPAVETLSGLLGGVLTDAAELFGQYLSDAVPLLLGYADVLKGLTPAFDSLINAGYALNGAINSLRPVFEEFLLNQMRFAVTALQVFARYVEVAARNFQAVVSTVAPLLGGFTDMSGDLDALSSAFDKAIRSVVVFSAQVLKFFGANALVANLVKAYAPKDEKEKVAGRVAAPKDFGFKGFEEIMKENTLRAASAQGGGGKADREAQRDEWAKGTYEELLKVQAGTLNLETTIKEAVDKIAEVIRDRIPSTNPLENLRRARNRLRGQEG